MNIIELAREKNIVPYIISPRNDEYLDRLQAFAAAVIKAHEAKLLEGVGEPALSRRKDREYLDTYEYREGNSDPMFWEQFYTASQVAGAVLKAKQERDAELVAGVGEPHKCCMNCAEHGECHPNNERGCDYQPEFEYTKEQVAAAVAQERKSTEETWAVYDKRIDCDAERIAELEAGNHDLRKWIDATGQGVLLQRLATLESTLRVALDALEIYGSQAPAVNETIAKIKEVLHD